MTRTWARARSRPCRDPGRPPLASGGCLMASLNARQAARDAASFDNDRKDGRYANRNREPFVSDWGSRPGDAEKQVALDAAMAQIEQALSRPNGVAPMFPKVAADRREAA